MDRAVAERLAELEADKLGLVVYKIKRGCYQIGEGPVTYLRLVRNILLGRLLAVRCVINAFTTSLRFESLCHIVTYVHMCINMHQLAWAGAGWGSSRCCCARW